jgi:hypothetical protein
VWLTAASAMTLFGVALPLPARLAICVGAATLGAAGICRTCLHYGRNSVRALAWREGGALLAWTGPERSRHEVRLGSGSFRLGTWVFFLWLESCDGCHAVFIDTGRQDAFAIRRLARRLNRAPGRGADECNTAS